MITPKGYRRIRYGGRMRMEHDVVWERHHGPIPKGMQVHHRNEDKLANAIDNLELLTALEHKRRHSCVGQRSDGVWLKRCPACGEIKPLDEEHWYWRREGWPNHACRPCHVKRAVVAKQHRKATLAQPTTAAP